MRFLAEGGGFTLSGLSFSRETTSILKKLEEICILIFSNMIRNNALINSLHKEEQCDAKPFRKCSSF